MAPDNPIRKLSEGERKLYTCTEKEGEENDRQIFQNTEKTTPVAAEAVASSLSARLILLSFTIIATWQEYFEYFSDDANRVEGVPEREFLTILVLSAVTSSNSEILKSVHILLNV